MIESEVSAERLESLLALARQVLANAWSPYSGLSVGAALLCADGAIATGCNVENASFGLTLCAERTALCAAVASGRRDFTAIAIASDGARTLLPCGACRQVLAEFARDLIVVSSSAGGERIDTSLAELLPRPFAAPDLEADPGAGEEG